MIKSHRIQTLISVVLTVIMVISVVSVMPTANAAGTTYNVSTAQQLADACAAINTSGGEATISLTADISGNTANIGISKNGAEVTVIGNGHTLTAPISAIDVSNGAKVYLGDGNSTLTLKSIDTEGSNPGIVFVDEGSQCHMYDKVTLKDHKGDTYFGGGVTVHSGLFHMHGGTIDNCGIGSGSVCYGGGVAVYAGGEFIMDGGTISNCYATSDYIDDYDPNRCFTAMGGGVYVTEGSTFIMNNGTISGCSATNFGGGVAVDLSYGEYTSYGMGNIKSRAVINGGTIENNTADSGAGVFASGYFYSYAGQIATYHPGMGSPESPGVFINGGEIKSNAADSMGGGVLIAMIRPAQTVQLHNARISNNTADSGAGVENFGYWTQMDIDGCTISGNEAASNGGGVMASSNSSNGFTSIKNTEISGNTSGGRGAGVYYDANSEIRISGADVIQNNTYSGKLNNLNILSLEKPVSVIGDLTGSQIGLSDPTLWDDDKDDTATDAVSTKRLTDGFKANNDSIIPANAFTSDHESWYVDYGEKVTSSNTTYKYTAQKYNNNLGMDEGYFIKLNESNNAEYIKFDAVTFDDKPKASTSFMTELDQRFRNEGYTFVMDYYYRGYSSYPGKIYQDPKSEVYIALLKVGDYTVYICTSDDTDYLQSNIGGYSALQGAGNLQDYDGGENGKVVLVSHGYYDDDSLFSGVSATEEELEFDEPLDFEGAQTKTIYKINDYGFATTKYVISKDSEDDGSYDYTGEVRLVRSEYEVNYHINNADMDKDIYTSDIFTPYVTNNTVEPGKTIQEFHNIPQLKDPDGYIFKGWYYADGTPVKFGEDTYQTGDKYVKYKDIYAHWEPVEEIEKDPEDDKVLPADMHNKYRNFGLFGVQIRPRYYSDINYDETHRKDLPGGLRFITSLSNSMLERIGNLCDKKVVSDAGYQHNVEYGYVVAPKRTVQAYVNYYQASAEDYKLQYKGTDVNGVNTTVEGNADTDYNYIKNVDCTARDDLVDHKDFSEYRLSSMVITYEGESAAYKDAEICARAYLRYYDANGLLRTFYNDYDGTTTFGGCCISYTEAEGHMASNTNTYYKQEGA